MPRLCIITPIAMTKQNLRTALQPTPFSCEYLESVMDYFAYESSGSPPIDIFIVDYTMTESELLNFLHYVKNQPGFKKPIMVMSAMSDRKTIIELLKQGADDYVLKPFVASNLLERLDRLINLYVPDTAQLFPQTLVLDLGSILELELSRAHRHGYSFSFVRLFFTLIESKDQTPRGDELVELMKKVFGLLLSQYRKTDLVLASGGDSFVICLPFTDKYGTHIVIKRMAKNLEALKAQFPPHLYFVEIGHASYPEDAGSVAGLINYVAREKRAVSYYLQP